MAATAEGGRVNGDAFGINSRLRPDYACEADDDQPIRLAIKNLRGSSTVTVDLMSRMTGLTSAEVREALDRLTRRGIIESVTA